MRILVTGASGYLGRALCARLRADGHEVRALVRPSSDRAVLERAGARLVVGDVLEPPTLPPAMDGADWAVHAAADLDLRGPRGRMERVNVEGSQNVAAAAATAEVPRFLSVSSVAYFGGSPDDGSPATEDSPPRQPFPTRYSATKHAAQRAIEGWAARGGFELATVYPSLIYGPPGRRAGVNAMLRAFLKGRIPFLVEPDKKTSWVYLADVVEAIARILEAGVAGRGYLLAGEVTTMRRLAHELCALAGVEPPRRELSARTARLAVLLATPLYRLRGFRPPVPREQLRSLERHWAFDDGRARRELDWRPRPLAEGLPPTVAHLLE